jgi:hypothetical protein
MREGMLTAVVFFVFFVFNIRATWFNLKDLHNLLTPQFSMSSSHEAVEFFALSPYYSDSDFIINFDDNTALPIFADYYAPLGKVYPYGYTQNAIDFRDKLKKCAQGDIYITPGKSENGFQTISANLSFENDAYKIYQLAENSLLLQDYHGLAHAMQEATIKGEYTALRELTGNDVSFELMAFEELRVDLYAKFYDDLEIEGQFRAKASVNG